MKHKNDKREHQGKADSKRFARWHRITIEAFIIGMATIATLAIIYLAWTGSQYPSINRISTATATAAAVSPTLSHSLASPSATEISAYYYEANLEGFGNYSPEDLEPGAMEFQYPVYLLPNSSEIVYLTITPNLDLLTNLPDIFQRIPIPFDVPLEMGEYYTHASNVLVARQMQASLVSEGINVVAEFDSPLKEINSTRGAVWLWTIKAPDVIGTHPLLLRLYLGDNPEPIWSFSFTISITYPTQTPSPTPTETPTSTATSVATYTPSVTPTDTVGKRLEDVFISKAPDTLGDILSFGGVIVAAFVGFLGVGLGAVLQQRLGLLKTKEADENSATKPPTAESPKPAANRKQKRNDKDHS